MPSQKIENLLNLALDATPEERRKSLQLDVGYDESDRTYEVLIQYQGDISFLTEASVEYTLLFGNYAILRLPAELVEPVSLLPQITYMEKPKRLYFAASNGRASSCINPLHDILIVLAFYVLSRFSVGSTFIAVMLTILGYSINATIVIFDRIRENLSIMKGSSLKLIVNTSVTQTLTRSIYSSLTTFITIFVLYLLGVPSVREFALPIIVGILVGAYSSVCLTGSLWYIMKTKLGKKKIIDKEEVPELSAAETSVPGASAKPAPVKAASAAPKKKTAKKDRSELQSVKPKKGRRRR